MSVCSECGKGVNECATCPAVLYKGKGSYKVAKDLNSYPYKVEQWQPRENTQGTRKIKDYCPYCNQMRYVRNDKGSINITFGEPYYCGNDACNSMLDNGID